MLALLSTLLACTASPRPGAPTASLPPRRPVASLAPRAATPPSSEEVDALLAARAAAVLTHDRSGWLAPVDGAAPAFRRAQSDAWSVVTQLPVGSWRWTRVGGVTGDRSDATPGPASSAANPPGPVHAGSVTEWSVRVRLEYRLRGIDPAVVQRDSTLALRRAAAGRWALAGERAPSAPAPWDAAPAQVLRREGVLLVVSTGAGPARRWGDLVAAAARRVRRLLGPPRLRPLVVVPAPSSADPGGHGAVHPPILAGTARCTRWLRSPRARGSASSRRRSTASARRAGSSSSPTS